jgi:hypothetical protein
LLSIPNYPACHRFPDISIYPLAIGKFILMEPLKCAFVTRTSASYELVSRFTNGRCQASTTGFSLLYRTLFAWCRDVAYPAGYLS